jgi:hypothetical protein
MPSGKPFITNLTSMSRCGAFSRIVFTSAGDVATMSTWPLVTAVISVASSSKRTICASLAPSVASLSFVVPRVLATRLPARSS